MKCKKCETAKAWDEAYKVWKEAIKAFKTKHSKGCKNNEVLKKRGEGK